MPSKTYIEFPDVIGDSKDGIRLGWFNVLSFGFNYLHFTVEYLSFTVNTSGGSAVLAKAYRVGEHFKKVRLDAIRPNKSLHFRLEFNDALISSSNEGEPNFFHLRFESMKSIHYNEAGVKQSKSWPPSAFR